ncbi:MAG: hypothetical protein MUP58_03690 [Candidatus Nanohaloarchaeota archaeon QJJ-9]|nr:hypothetical protein [Candidatus Nanohaloarchaeota archaeon QJJ-9]
MTEYRNQYEFLEDMRKLESSGVYDGLKGFLDSFYSNSAPDEFFQEAYLSNSEDFEKAILGDIYDMEDLDEQEQYYEVVSRLSDSEIYANLVRSMVVWGSAHLMNEKHQVREDKVKEEIEPYVRGYVEEKLYPSIDTKSTPLWNRVWDEIHQPKVDEVGWGGYRVSKTDDTMEFKYLDDFVGYLMEEAEEDEVELLKEYRNSLALQNREELRNGIDWKLTDLTVDAFCMRGRSGVNPNKAGIKPFETPNFQRLLGSSREQFRIGMTAFKEIPMLRRLVKEGMVDYFGEAFSRSSDKNFFEKILSSSSPYKIFPG